MKNSPMLFDSFGYGMAKGAITKKVACSPCPDAPNNKLMICTTGDVPYIDQDWQEVFYFNNLDELQQVMLVRPGNDWLPALNSLEKAGWRPVFFESRDGVFDIFENLRNNSVEECSKSAQDFAERAFQEGELSISCFPSGYSPGLATYNEALDKAPENIVITSLMAGNGNLRLAFIAPLLSRKNALRYGEMIKRH